jgi:hypothetical protein
MPVESGVKRLREQEFDWAVEQKRVQILLDTTVSSAANATTESGGEAETQVGSGGASEWARAAELAEPEWASHSAATRYRVEWRDVRREFRSGTRRRHWLNARCCQTCGE